MITRTQTKPRRFGGISGGIWLVGADGCEQRLVIKLPRWCVLRLAARSFLLAIAIISLPWLLSNSPKSNFSSSDSPSDIAFLPLLLRDLKQHGIFHPGMGRSALFLGSHTGRNPEAMLLFLNQNKIELVAGDGNQFVPDESLEFLVSPDSLDDADNAALIERVLAIGGIAVVRLGSRAYPIPLNYKIVYVRRFSSTMVAIKKVGNSGNVGYANNVVTGRKLLAVPEAKKAVLSGLEDALLEPPRRGKNPRKTRYLPDLLGDTLDRYPRRVFIDVGGGEDVEGWFEKQYPRRNRQFEIIRLEMEEAKEVEGDEMSRWLRGNVREEDYVVMKAEAEAVEGLVRSGAIELVDELFLECRHQWEKGDGRRKGGKRAYWECLALFGRLRDEGVAVHQWWG